MSTTRLILAFTILGLCTTGCRFRSPLQKTDTKTSLLEGATTDAKVQSFLVKLQPSMETDLQTQLQLSNQEVFTQLDQLQSKMNLSWGVDKLLDAQRKGMRGRLYFLDRKLVGFYLLESIPDKAYDVLLDVGLAKDVPHQFFKVLIEQMQKDFPEHVAGLNSNPKKPHPLFWNTYTAYSDKVTLALKLGLTSMTDLGPLAEANQAGDLNFNDAIYGDRNAKKASNEISTEFEQDLGKIILPQIIEPHVKETEKSREYLRKAVIDLEEYYAFNYDKHTDYSSIKPEILEKISTLACVEKAASSYLLIGEAGAGKSFNLDLVMAKFARGLIDLNPKCKQIEKRFLRISEAMFKAGTSFRGQLENRINAILKLSETSVAVIQIDELAELMAKETDDVLGKFKAELATGRIKIFASTTLEEYYASVFTNQALKTRFIIDYIDAPSFESLVEILAYGAQKEKWNCSGDCKSIARRMVDLIRVADPNGGVLRSQINFFQIIASKVHSGTAVSIDMIEKEFKTMYNIDPTRTALPGSALAEQHKIISAFNSDVLDSNSKEKVQLAFYAPLAEERDHGMALQIKGPADSSVRLSKQLANHLGRNWISIDLGNRVKFANVDQVLTEIAHIADNKKTGGPLAVIAFENFSSANALIQEQLAYIFQQDPQKGGSVITQPHNQLHKIPFVWAHFLTPADQPDANYIDPSSSIDVMSMPADSRFDRLYNEFLKTSSAKKLLSEFKIKEENLREIAQKIYDQIKTQNDSTMSEQKFEDLSAGFRKLVLAAAIGSCGTIKEEVQRIENPGTNARSK